MLAVARDWNFFKAAGKPTAKHYVQDGLVAMWDGIENAGWGVHDPNATVWKDLVGSNDLTLTQSSYLYFAETYLYANRGQYAAGDISKIPANLNNVTYEACWNRRNLFDGAADSFNTYGQMVLDVHRGSLWYRCSSRQDGGWFNTPPNGIGQNVPFTQSMICQYNGSRDTIIPFVNGTQISNTTPYINTGGGSVRIGSGWGSPASSHYCVRVYSRALTAKELVHNHVIDKERFGLP